MINRNAAKVHVNNLRSHVTRLTEEIDALEERSSQGLFYDRQLIGDDEPREFGPNFGVGWSNRKEPHLTINDEEVTPDQAMQIAVSAFWMVFESSRDISNPGDNKAFKKHMDAFREQARLRCHQRDRISEMCTGHLVHDEFTLCPVHDK